MAQRRDSQRKSLPAILMKTNMKQSEGSEEEFVGGLQDVLDVDRHTCRSTAVGADMYRPHTN